MGNTKKDNETQTPSLPFTNLRYNLETSKQAPTTIQLVRRTSLAKLYARYGNTLWEEGGHKTRVSSFIGELHEILLGSEFSTFDDEQIDHLIGVLRERGNSNATINRKMAALSKLLRKAYRMGDIHSLPEFRRQKERAGRIRFLSTSEERRLFQAIRDRNFDAYRLSVFLVDTGARLGEAQDLAWSDVGDKRATFWITKSGRSRTVPLTKRAQEAITVNQVGSRGPFSMITQHKYRSIWNDAKMDIGLGDDPEVVPHVLRHTCASRLVRGGIDIRRVQIWLGHQTLHMTMRYAHLMTNDLESCIAILECGSSQTEEVGTGSSNHQEQ